MKIKSSILAVLIATGLFVAVGAAQADCCYRNTPGWHMVSKCCNYTHAENWQQYASGYYLPPVSDQNLLMFPAIDLGFTLWGQ